MKNNIFHTHVAIEWQAVVEATKSLNIVIENQGTQRKGETPFIKDLVLQNSDTHTYGDKNKHNQNINAKTNAQNVKKQNKTKHNNKSYSETSVNHNFHVDIILLW